MISIDGKGESFSFRIAGIFVYNNRILLQKAIKSGAWVLPGGRSEINETSGEALIREMKEELGVEISIKRLVWIIENFNAYETKGLHDKWDPVSPDRGRDKLLWMMIEAGEIADVIKKKGDKMIMDDIDVRNNFIEEMCDTLMYFNDVMLCYDISPQELEQIYLQKHQANMERW